MVQFTVTVPFGTGGGYYIDGVQKPIVPVVTGGTFRFNQNDSTNNNHPLILSTTTSTAGIISTGVSYYLDGVSNQANYLNTSLFNAAYVRYIEITVAQTADFFYLCNVHGSGMGNSMDVTGDTWGALGWNIGEWGDQNDIDVAVTGNALSLSLLPTNGWGELTWNASNNTWGGLGLVGVAIGAQVDVTAQLLNLTLASVDPSPDVAVTGIQMTTSLGQVDADPDAIVTGQSLTLSLQGVLVDIVTPVDVTTQLLNLTLANVDPSPDVAVTGIQMNMSINSVSIDSTVVTGQGLTTSLNSVTPIVDVTVNVTGQQLTTSLNSPTFIGNGVVNLTGNLLTISLNSINNQIWTEINTGTAATWTEIDTAA